MKPITKYQANDGSVWATAEAAVAREQEADRIDAIMRALKPRPDSCSFSNGDLGYVQHDPLAFARVWHALIKVARERGESVVEWINRNSAQLAVAGNVDASWFCRFIDDNGPLCNAFSRLQSIDKDAREWGQPFLRWNESGRTVKAEYQP
jgi:hypothetical protein